MSGTGWSAVIGGAISIVGQFWGTNYYLPLIGGAIAGIAGIIAVMKK